MKRKYRPKPIPLVVTEHLIYEPRHELVWDRRTYYDAERPLCFGKLLSATDYQECPPNLLDEWGQIVIWHMKQVMMKATGKE